MWRSARVAHAAGVANSGRAIGVRSARRACKPRSDGHGAADQFAGNTRARAGTRRPAHGVFCPGRAIEVRTARTPTNAWFGNREPQRGAFKTCTACAFHVRGARVPEPVAVVETLVRDGVALLARTIGVARAATFNARPASIARNDALGRARARVTGHGAVGHQAGPKFRDALGAGRTQRSFGRLVDRRIAVVVVPVAKLVASRHAVARGMGTGIAVVAIRELPHPTAAPTEAVVICVRTVVDNAVAIVVLAIAKFLRRHAARIRNVRRIDAEASDASETGRAEVAKGQVAANRIVFGCNDERARREQREQGQ